MFDWCLVTQNNYDQKKWVVWSFFFVFDWCVQSQNYCIQKKWVLSFGLEVSHWHLLVLGTTRSQSLLQFSLRDVQPPTSVGWEKSINSTRIMARTYPINSLLVYIGNVFEVACKLVYSSKYVYCVISAPSSIWFHVLWFGRKAKKRKGPCSLFSSFTSFKCEMKNEGDNFFHFLTNKKFSNSAWKYRW